MTETEWNACTDPQEMLVYLGNRATKRKLRLFICACYWASRALNLIRTRSPGQTVQRGTVGKLGAWLWQNLIEPSAQLHRRANDSLARGLEEMEQHWDDRDLRDTLKRHAKRYFDRDNDEGLRIACGLPVWDNLDDASESCVTVEHAAQAALSYRRGLDETLWIARCQTDRVRDIFGPLPFRPVMADPLWLSFSVGELAKGIYADRAFDRMPILGDALEESGCYNSAILEHCRYDGEHVRGCWVVDLLLNKS